jgi:hypothetical protein
MGEIMSSYQNYVYSHIDNSSDILVKKIVDKILRSGRMSPQDHALLTSTAFNHGDISDGKRRQINRIFDHIQIGQLKLVNW